jgi:hypothetical protein
VPRCAGIRPDGSQCERVITSEATYCYSHDPARKEQRKKAATKAGSTPWKPELRAAKNTLKKLAQDVLDGKVNRADGSVVAQIYGVLCRYIEAERRIKETEELQARLEELEELAEQQKGGGSRGYGF